jgi:hypothetical protein
MNILKELMLMESAVAFETPHVVVYAPTTAAEAKSIAPAAPWDFTETDANLQRYTKYGPVFIIVRKKTKEKWAVWFGPNQPLCADKNSTRPYDIEALESRWPELSQFFDQYR